MPALQHDRPVDLADLAQERRSSACCARRSESCAPSPPPGRDRADASPRSRWGVPTSRARLGKPVERLLAVTLERVGRGPRLEAAAAEHVRAHLLHDPRARADLGGDSTAARARDDDRRARRPGGRPEHGDDRVSRARWSREAGGGSLFGLGAGDGAAGTGSRAPRGVEDGAGTRPDACLGRRAGRVRAEHLQEARARLQLVDGHGHRLGSAMLPSKSA